MGGEVGLQLAAERPPGLVWTLHPFLPPLPPPPVAGGSPPGLNLWDLTPFPSPLLPLLPGQAGGAFISQIHSLPSFFFLGGGVRVSG